MVMQACNHSAWMIDTGGSGVQGHSQQHSKFKASLGYIRPCLKIFFQLYFSINII